MNGSMTPDPSEDFAIALTDRYDRGADAYRVLWAPILRTAALPLVRELSGERVERVLDVGTGVGALLPDLCSTFPGSHVLGVDRSRGMLAQVPKPLGRAVMDARQLALPAESMDRVFLVFMLFHLESPLAGLREARRVLRPGGRIGTLTWAGELQSKATRVWADCLDAHGAVGPDPSTEARHETVDAPAKMEALLGSAGFDAPRSWEDDLACTLDADHLLRLRTSLGSAKPRFDSLSPEAASACLEEARCRMKELGSEGFVARGRVVYAVAGA
jgi:SAM-dependent methyltransferase